MPHPTNSNIASPGRVAAELLFFFVAAYALSWSFWGCAIWLNLSVAPGQSGLGRTLYLAGIQGPFLAALTLSWIRGGATAVWDLLSRLIRPPFNPIWLVVAVAIVPLIMLAAFGVAVLVDGVAIPRSLVVRPLMGWPMMVVGQLLVMNGEEYGWRGYALPRIAKLGGTLGAALLLGVLWALWHVPLFYTVGAWQHGSILLYVESITATCVVQAAIFFRAHQSVISAMLFHGSLNASAFVLDLPERTDHYLPWVWGLAVILSVLILPKPLFRMPAATRSAAR